MRAILHIGAEKTGSTTLQAFLRDNRDALSARGIALLNSSGAEDDRALATFAMSDELRDDHSRELGIDDGADRARWRRDFTRHMEAELRALPEHTRCVLMSSEHLHSRLRSEADIARLRELLAPWFSEFRIIVYLRRQDRLAVSWFSTYYKSGGTASLAERRRQQASFDPHFYRYDELLDKWAAVFGAEALRPRLFARAAFVGGTLVSDFLQAAGIGGEPQDYRQAERRNAALDNQALELLRQFNLQFPSRGRDASARRCMLLRLRLIERLEASHAGTPQVATEAEARAFYDNFRAGNARLARQWFQRDSLFDEDFSMYPQRLDEAALDFSLATTLFHFLREELERKLDTAGADSEETGTPPPADGNAQAGTSLPRALRRRVASLRRRWQRLRAP